MQLINFKRFTDITIDNIPENEKVFLESLFRTMRIVFVENKDKDYYATLGIAKIEAHQNILKTELVKTKWFRHLIEQLF